MPDALTAWLLAIGALALLTVVLAVVLDLPAWVVVLVVAAGVVAGASTSLRGR
ncbi:MAG: hypothetical protein ACR2L8_08375 [Solirubrobacteraceae bacterium]